MHRPYILIPLPAAAAMQITAFFVSAMLAASSVRAADRATEKECHQMAGMERMEKLAANETMMAMVFKNNEAKMARFKAKAAEAQPKLAALQANATLVGECAVVNAVVQENRDCRKMAQIERMMTFAANDTALQAKFEKVRPPPVLDGGGQPRRMSADFERPATEPNENRRLQGQGQGGRDEIDGPAEQHDADGFLRRPEDHG